LAWIQVRAEVSFTFDGSRRRRKKRGLAEAFGEIRLSSGDFSLARLTLKPSHQCQSTLALI